ncbi:MarR family winged helix-turn-helix transcriptional regulator [Nocardioides lianchengensis]|uniref:MarR family winged helix-turn-helix transcriptional regulator n=1 Tax=Nocardioides lianchengensis TaxID=1045774 RepID=UPI00185A22E6|nr:MarR family transcriptional regulator [Nocardioides lianchengensis]NYG12740.1 DNA-binding MarR family transcriptional regulator [Nocardioides lianchengensis]
MSTDIDLASDLVTYAARLVRAVRRSAELPAGLRLLSILDELGPSTVTALAAADRTSQPTTTAAVRDLLARDLVDKQPHPDDARSSLVGLTDAGRTELARVRRRNGEAVAARLDALDRHSPEDLATAVAVLRSVLDPTPERGHL